MSDVKNIAENADNLIKIITNIKEQVGGGKVTSGETPVAQTQKNENWW